MIGQIFRRRAQPNAHRQRHRLPDRHALQAIHLRHAQHAARLEELLQRNQVPRLVERAQAHRPHRPHIRQHMHRGAHAEQRIQQRLRLHRVEQKQAHERGHQIHARLLRRILGRHVRHVAAHRMVLRQSGPCRAAGHADERLQRRRAAQHVRGVVEQMRQQKDLRKHGHIVEDVGAQAPLLRVNIQLTAARPSERDLAAMAGTLFQHPRRGGAERRGRIVANADAAQDRVRRQRAGDGAAERLDGVPDLVGGIVGADAVRIAVRQEDLAQRPVDGIGGGRHRGAVGFERHADDHFLICVGEREGNMRKHNVAFLVGALLEVLPAGVT